MLYICFVCHKEKQKKEASRVPKQGHSGKGCFFLKKKGHTVPRVLGMGHLGKKIF
jgi:hypothetical protein